MLCVVLLAVDIAAQAALLPVDLTALLWREAAAGFPILADLLVQGAFFLFQARGFTGRSLIVKFEGCYHGHVDSLLVKAGSGGATFDVPDSAGVPADFARNTLTLTLNDVAGLKRVKWDEIACAIIEPVPGNMGLIVPPEGYLMGLQALCKKYGTLLIIGAAAGNAGMGAGIGAAVGLLGGALIGDQLQAREKQEEDVQRRIQAQQAEIDHRALSLWCRRDIFRISAPATKRTSAITVVGVSTAMALPPFPLIVATHSSSGAILRPHTTSV